ncbi:unnamed protein product [Paramecium sonneborni]|uniref:Agglutinin domain-containing protein n=1 Tax=Paramecium sonneborni TaxID=65129 RepID=A0A8S1PRT1_9CILI|nr:unnamed protein product [Paramecium sonneborni]
MSNNSGYLIASFVPLSVPTRYLSAATNKSRALDNDYDVRVTNKNQEHCYFLLEKVSEGVYKIRLLTQPNHFVFCSNDNTRKFKDQFDVRTHAFDEKRNNWIIENAGWSCFTIRSETNPDQYMFIADDFSNQHNGEFDVRTHSNKDQEKNLWFIVITPNILHPYPSVTQKMTVQFKPLHIQNNYLTISDAHPQFKSDFVAKITTTQNLNSSFYLEQVHDNKYIIRSASHPLQVLFVANDKQHNKWGDFDVRFHSFNEERNKWIIEQVGKNEWTIKSASNPDQFLFAVQDEANGKEFPIRTHPCVEDRNKWFIEGFQK